MHESNDRKEAHVARGRVMHETKKRISHAKHEVHQAWEDVGHEACRARKNKEHVI